jgi:multimeric flavodoxin WrbA
MENSKLTALALVCTLKRSPEPSSSELLANQVLAELKKHGVEGESLRVVDFDVKPGVKTDMGHGDEWPALRERLLAADILFLSTATWMGHASSVAHRVLERLDAELSETDDEGRPHLFGKVAIAGVVGNEDGAHDAVAQIFQALNDVGYTIPAQGSTYWNGEAMQKTNYIDLPQVPDAVAGTNATVAANAAHLAGLLQKAIYPSP